MVQMFGGPAEAGGPTEAPYLVSTSFDRTMTVWALTTDGAAHQILPPNHLASTDFSPSDPFLATFGGAGGAGSAPGA